MLLDKLKETFIKTANSVSNEFIRVLQKNTDSYSDFARHIHIFIHERIDSMLILIVNNCFWDADIILRSVAEASVKLAYVSSFNDEKNENIKINEFWNELAEINRIKQSKQAKEIAETINIKSKLLTDLILPIDEENILREKWTKKERQKIEQPWSYNEMIKVIAKETNRNEILCLNRNFTQSSHLIHADETALGVIAERKQRNNEDKILQYILHENRLYSDMLTLYFWALDVTLKVFKEKESDDLLKLRDKF